ncbi:MAG: metal-dependent hydrolase [Halobacteriales archaeon]|nr:metal-dependent hydrolase [Halobacteriales archaeon]
MPSTVVHVAFGLLCGAALLGARFDRRAALVVIAACIIPDLDTFTSLVIASTHRAMLHTLLVPGALALVLWHGTVHSGWLRGRLAQGDTARLWTGLFAYVAAGIGLDMFTALGVNPLYPVIDQFVAIDGRVGYESGRGLFQSFVEVSEPTTNGGGGVDIGQRGSTETVHVASGIDPSRGVEEPNTERIFPVVFRGWHVTLVLAGVLATWLGLRDTEADT